MSEELTRRFAELTGDRNRIHFDAASAQKLGFRGTIVPGALVFGLISGAVYQAFGDGVLLCRIPDTPLKGVILVGAWVHFIIVVRRPSRVARVDIYVRNGRKTVYAVKGATVIVPKPEFLLNYNY